MVERIQSFLDELSLEFDGRRVLLIGHAATRWALDHLLIVLAPFEWQEGWTYRLD